MLHMVLGAMIVGGMIGNYAARRQYESMSAADAQEARIDQAQAQAAQAAQAQAASQGKKDITEELKIARLKQRRY